MVGELRLEVRDFAGPARWRWVLTGPGGEFLTDHEVRLETDQWEFEAFADLQGYLRRHVTPDRRTEHEAQIVADVGRWIGKEVFGSVGAAMTQLRPMAVRVIVPLDPPEAERLMYLPLELGHAGGRPLAMQDVTLVLQHGLADVSADIAPVGDRLRVLGLFSLPHRSRPLNLRRERQALVRLFRKIGAVDRAVEVRVLQYGVTRQRLTDVLEEDEGWDVIHISGHGGPGELALEADDGSADVVTTAELVELLDLARERVKLVTVSACWSAALTLAEHRRLLRLPTPESPRAAEPRADLDSEPGQGGRPVGALAAELADRLGCAVLAMRFPVVDDFAIALARKLYDLLVADGRPLPRALGMALKTAAAGCRPALSVATPALFGARAVDLRLAAPQRRKPISYDTEALKLAGFPPQPEHFVGRTAVMARASAALAAHSGASGVLLHGMPGGGKTACALELAYTHDHAFEKLVWFKAPDDGLDIADALTRFVRALEAGLPGLRMVHLLDDQAQLAAFLPSMTELLEQRRPLIVVDNIESLLTEAGQRRDERWGLVAAALCGHDGLGRVVWTSRRRPAALDGRVQVEAVDALSLDEALLLARELPNLSKLLDAGLPGVEPEVARALARGVLEVAQGHPKLLELANGQAAHPDRLQQMVDSAGDAWQETGGLPEGFFATGEAHAAGEDYLHLLAAWTRAAANGLTPAQRDLFCFVCCLEEADRFRLELEYNWAELWQRLARPGHPPGLDNALTALSAAGLVEFQTATQRDAEKYGIHPGVATVGRDLAGPEFRDAVDTRLAAYWASLAQYARDREDEEQTSWMVVRGGLAQRPT